MFSTAAFTQAYRAYAPEQGNDTTLSMQKATEVQSQTAGQVGGLFESDTVAISPEAAKMYAEQVRKRHTVISTLKLISHDATSSPTSSVTEDK